MTNERENETPEPLKSPEDEAVKESQEAAEEGDEEPEEGDAKPA